MKHSLNAADTTVLTASPLAEPPLPVYPIGGGLQLTFADRASQERMALERFVAQAFERKHDAVVRTFMPVLVGCRDRERRLRSVVGLRPATTEALYLERYLDRPVHELISEAGRCTVRRASIVEVGNLAGRNCRAAVRVVASLPRVLLAMNFEWVVFTATSVVREMLATLGAPLIELAPASEACAAGGIDRWGGYYRNDPRVCVAWLPAALKIPAFSSRPRDH